MIFKIEVGAEMLQRLKKAGVAAMVRGSVVGLSACMKFGSCAFVLAELRL